MVWRIEVFHVGEHACQQIETLESYRVIFPPTKLESLFLCFSSEKGGRSNAKSHENLKSRDEGATDREVDKGWATTRRLNREKPELPRSETRVSWIVHKD